jgi:protein phosphatase
VTARTGRTRLRWGGATDVGRVRPGNQDQFVARDDVGLWAVADGMGGHRGGEVASEIACDTIARAFDQHTIDGLVDAIEQANRAVYEAGSRDPDLTGMGTTVVALAVVQHEGDELLAIANVGDSRVYRYAGGELDQLTVDHSLVADLVREGSLSPEQAAVHPQRNIVTRVLGVHDDVPVDALGVEPHHGDRYVLCSDGLFNEVPEPGIASVLRRLADPVDAAGELVRLALEGGGRDNVTVVIVDVVDDGGRSEAASAAVGADGEPVRGAVVAERTAATGAYAEATGAAGARTRRPGRRATARSARRAATAAAPAAAGTADVDGDRLDDVGGDDDDYYDDAPASARDGRGGGRRRRVTWRVVLFTVVLVAVVGGAIATIQWYGRAAYFVGFQGDQVAIFKGRPGGLLWIDPSLVESTDLERDRVPASRLRDLENGKEQASLADAQRYVRNISAEADELDPPTTTTTIPAVPTVPPTAPTGSTLTPLTSTPAPAVPG